QREKELIQSIRSLKEQIDLAHVEEQQAEREGNYARVAEIRYGRVQELDRQLTDANARLEELQQNERMLKEQVEEEDVAKIVAKWMLQRLSQSGPGFLSRRCSKVKFKNSYAWRSCWPNAWL